MLATMKWMPLGISKINVITLAKIAITAAALSHIGYFIAGIFLGYLGANPVEVITHAMGEWALHFLLITLSITPLRRHFHWNALMRLRRFLGLWSFFYLSLHFFVFIFFDHFFNLASILEDIIDRPYIAVGFIAFILMVPLAITSFKKLQRWLGKRWIVLHRTVYLVAILGIVHYWWLVKADILWPLVYGLILVILLADRLYWKYKKR